MLYPIELRAQGLHSNRWTATYEIHSSAIGTAMDRYLGELMSRQNARRSGK